MISALFDWELTLPASAADKAASSRIDVAFEKFIALWFDASVRVRDGGAGLAWYVLLKSSWRLGGKEREKKKHSIYVQG